MKNQINNKDIQELLEANILSIDNQINYYINPNKLQKYIQKDNQNNQNNFEDKELIEENKQLLSILILAISGLFNQAETKNIINNMDRGAVVSNIKNINSDYEKKRKIISILNNGLLEKLKIVESGNNPKKIGDNGRAYGILQIHKEVIDDVNQIYHTNFEHKDAFDERKSEIICKLYLMHYGSKLQDNLLTENNLARIWNGGPKGYLKQATLSYVKKLNKISI